MTKYSRIRDKTGKNVSQLILQEKKANSHKSKQRDHATMITKVHVNHYG